MFFLSERISLSCCACRLCCCMNASKSSSLWYFWFISPDRLHVLQTNLKWDSLKGHTHCFCSIATSCIALFCILSRCRETVVDVCNQIDFCHFYNTSSQSRGCPVSPQKACGLGSFRRRAHLKLSFAWWRTVHTQQIHCVSLIEHCSELGYCLPTACGPIEKLCTYSAALKLLRGKSLENVKEGWLQCLMIQV